MSLTYDEIKQTQPSLEKTLALAESKIGAAAALISEFAPNGFTFLGCGSSYSVAKSYEKICAYLYTKPARAIAAGDLMLHISRYAPALHKNIVFVLSRSGSTSEAVNAVTDLKKAADVRVISIVCAESSPLEAVSDLTLVMPWAFDNSVCQTRCVTCLYAAGAYIFAKIAGRDDVISSLRSVASSSGRFIEAVEPALREAAKSEFDRVAVLADGEIEGIAEEGALAFNEICQIPSNYYHLLDSRHGPMVLIKKGVAVLAAIDGGCKYEDDLIRDVTNKGALAIVYGGRTPPDDSVRLHIPSGENIDAIARGVEFLIICQLFSYFKSDNTGVNPDQPDGLDPWIKI